MKVPKVRRCSNEKMLGDEVGICIGDVEAMPATTICVIEEESLIIILS